MPSQDPRIVRGLSIAVIVLSSIALVGCAFSLLALAFGGWVLNDPSFFNSAYIEYHNDPEFMNALDSSGFTADDAIGLTMLGLGILGFGAGWVLLCSLLSLIAGIIGVRNHAKTEKLGSAFVWAIVGAVASLLSGRFITMILLIISAVYLNKIKNAPTGSYGQAQPVYGQPYPGQPGYGYGAPVYPQQPQYQQPTPESQMQAPAAPQSPTPPTPPEQQ